MSALSFPQQTPFWEKCDERHWHHSSFLIGVKASSNRHAYNVTEHQELQGKPS